MGWFGKKPQNDPPPTCPGNPGDGVSGHCAFANADESWSESFNLVDLLADVLKEKAVAFSTHPSWIVLRDSGLVLQPRLVSYQPAEGREVSTTTTLDVRHPTLIPDGLYEYQHAYGDGLVPTLRKGLAQWTETDLPVLLDALRDEPTTCSCISMPYPAQGDRPARHRRAVLGSVFHYRKVPAPDGEDPHPFCPCCFLTQSFDAFRAIVEGDGVAGIRFYAARTQEGEAIADCRINGDEYEPGKEALRAYVATWPGTGVEFRKQYVFVHTQAR